MGDVAVHALRGVSLTIREGESSPSWGVRFRQVDDDEQYGVWTPDARNIHSGWPGRFRVVEDQRAIFAVRKSVCVSGSTSLANSAVENVELPMLYAGVNAVERDRRAHEALAAVGLAGREQNHPNQLSGGQQQRVAVARALVNNPALILADEPTGNLDSRTSVEVMEIFQRLNRERDITLVLVTHEPDIAQYAQRVIVFKDGKIRKDYQIEEPRDAAEELRNLPPVVEDDDDDN